MSDILRAEVFPQIQEFCKRLPEVTEQKTLHQRIWEHLSSEDRVRQGTGAMMATHPIYYVGSETDPLPLNAWEYPKPYLERLRHLCLKDEFGNAASNYISGLMKQSRSRSYACPLTELIRDPDFIEDMQYREETEEMYSITGRMLEMITMNIHLKP
jgi:hypothetical protein